MYKRRALFKALLVCGAGTLSLTGCAVGGSPKLGVDDPCASLKAITADYENGFEKIKGSGSNYPSFRLYTAKVELVKGHCEIWEWAGGELAYACSATTPQSEVAAQRYSVTKDFVQSCVGSSWQQKEIEREQDGNRLGPATIFTSPSVPGLVISVQNNVPPKALRQLQSNVLYIGSKGKNPL
ncbi:hypothetical protein FE848_14735 [Marinobacter sp. 1-3A]|uniref:hypothetical protein n=1 Tax=Marinobacter sp. 1-3A TaxID=2582920 RepID=UPI001908B532|nr:hypothetical protein [Marinobacter sp. 1-3A]MBK1874479.1 hypothetical protein [Marinobacter sp. 1-3A]